MHFLTISLMDEYDLLNDLCMFWWHTDFCLNPLTVLETNRRKMAKLMPAVRIFESLTIAVLHPARNGWVCKEVDKEVWCSTFPTCHDSLRLRTALSLSFNFSFLWSQFIQLSSQMHSHSFRSCRGGGWVLNTSLSVRLCVGLELEISITPTSNMKDYWSTKMFLGNDRFGNDMILDSF